MRAKRQKTGHNKQYTAEVVAAYDEAEPYLLEFQTMEEQRAAERARVGREALWAARQGGIGGT